MPRQRSFIWDYFTKHENGEAHCHACCRRIQVNGGSTSNLIKHLRSMHKDLLQDQSSTNENETGEKDEYIVVEGDIDEYIEDGEVKSTPHFQIVASAPKMKKPRLSPMETSYNRTSKVFSDPLKTPTNRTISNGENSKDDSLEIFAKYMVSLMKGMPKKKCEEAQLKIVSVILEVKRDEGTKTEETPEEHHQ